MESSRSSECSLLCLLIDDSLSPFTEMEIFGEIQVWIHQLNCDSDDDAAIESACKSSCIDSHSEDRQCLSKIVADLIILLTVESQYVNHLVGKVLVVISEFLAASGSSWDKYINLLCICMELAMSNALSYPLGPSTMRAENSASSLFVLKEKLKYANWSTIAAVSRVLRNILKYLRQENEGQLVEVYLDSINSSFSNVPWDLLEDDTHVCQNDDIRKSSSTDTSFVSNVGEQEPKITFLGNFVQLLCSLVEESNFVEASDSLPNMHPVLFRIICLVPKLLCWCLGKQADCVNSGISQYFRHKLLVLMIRLNCITRLECSVIVSWLQLLLIYFQEILWQPITELESPDDCLEGSPFLFSVSDGEVHNISSRHLQRHAIFLFLKCSLSLIGMRVGADRQCASAAANSFFSMDSNSDVECDSRKTGFFELYKWLQWHLPTDTFMEHKVCLEKCINFSSSLFKLFLHEDDALFKFLLQLLNVPFCAEQRFNTEVTLQNAEDDTLYLISYLFNPVLLFHLFLRELHYDHQMLLDYLVSKDTGLRCAEYLLRCLRIVCDSWYLFVDFSICGRVINQSYCKKRKSLLDDSNSQLELYAQSNNNEILASLEKEDKRNHEYRGEPFWNANECLLSLKNSLESLHQKNLFPYNPKMLLKRLTIFQELCYKQEMYHLSRNGGTT